MRRTLYECSHAGVKGECIYCRKGHVLSLKSDDGSLDIRRLARGEPLALAICQGCSDFDCTGSPIIREDRGWIKHRRKVAVSHKRSKGNNAG